MFLLYIKLHSHQEEFSFFSHFSVISNVLFQKHWAFKEKYYRNIPQETCVSQKEEKKSVTFWK